VEHSKNKKGDGYYTIAFFIIISVVKKTPD
jgi:hypothetical protein